MIYAIVEDKTTNNDAYAILETYRNYSEMVKRTFSPESVIAWIIDTSRPPKGKTYNIKKSRLQSKANNYKHLLTIYPHLKVYAANDNIADYFHKYGKKYGLLKEFQAMRII